MSSVKMTAKAEAVADADGGLTPAEKSLLISTITHISGKIDFEKVANDTGVANAEAARKRLKRLLERQGIKAAIRGDRINEGDGESDARSTPKAKKARTAVADTSTPAKEVGRKRKAGEMDEAEEASKTDDKQDQAAAGNGGLGG